MAAANASLGDLRTWTHHVSLYNYWYYALFDTAWNHMLHPYSFPVIVKNCSSRMWTEWLYSFSVHQNYVGADGDKVPFFLSVVLTDANNQCVPQYRAILWKKTVTLILRVCTGWLKNPCAILSSAVRVRMEVMVNERVPGELVLKVRQRSNLHMDE